MKKEEKAKNERMINVGVLAMATEASACTQSCTDGDMMCCSRGMSLKNFSFTPSN